MKYPDFFDDVQSIRLYDPLAEFLGALEGGMMEFSYLDVVKNAGHSCPTVAGAYLMAREGLAALYPTQTPVRGSIFVAFAEDELEGVAGVIANVFTQITGSTKANGFKGINGNFARTQLMEFGQEMQASVILTRKDTAKSVAITYNPNCIEVNPKQKELMGKIMQKIATHDDVLEFRKLWQARVEAILNNADKVLSIKEV